MSGLISGRARLQALAAAVLFSTGGAAIKVDAFSGFQVSALRSGIAALALLAWAGGRVSLSGPILGAAVVYAGTLTFFVLATKLTTAANAIFLQSSSPLYILLLGPLLLGERFRPRDLLYVLVIAAGVMLCFLGQSVQATAPDPVTGNVFGVLSGVAWALTLIALRYVQRGRTDESVGMSAVVLGNLIACLVALPFAWPFPSAPAAQWATIGYLGVFQIGLAYICLTSAMRHLPALDASLLLLIEPVLNPMWTWMVRGERPGLGTIVGGALILAATTARASGERGTVRAEGQRGGDAQSDHAGRESGVM